MFVLLCFAGLQSVYVSAESELAKKNQRNSINRMELDTLKIQGNKELPKVLFVVPWQEVKSNKGDKEEQGLVLHSLYGDIFDPITPTDHIESN